LLQLSFLDILSIDLTVRLIVKILLHEIISWNVQGAKKFKVLKLNPLNVVISPAYYSFWKQ